MLKLFKRNRFLRRTCLTGCLVLTLPCSFMVLFLLFISILSPPIQTGSAPEPFPVDFMKGIVLESWWNGEFATPNTDRTLAEIIVPAGATWVAVVVKCFQDTATSTEIYCRHKQATATDDELRHVIKRAHGLGLKVMLKPHLDLTYLENSSSGRFQIGFGADEAAWKTWFDSYTRFIVHYAALAQELKVEYLVVGTELAGTAHRADNWRAVIQEVRGVYQGALTYASLPYFEPLQISWWDALDSIGVDAYFNVTLTNTPTLAQMRLGWTPAIAYLSLLARQWNKPIILTEVGYMSVDGTNVLPGDWSLQGDIDQQEQAYAYQALFEALQGQDWWKGVFWWSLSTNPDQGGAADRGYSFHNKLAEAVVRRYFNASEESR